MGDIERIEAARGGTFEYLLDGEVYAHPGPETISFQQVLAVLQDERLMAREVRMPTWKRRALRDAWAAHFDLPALDHAQRLCYVVDRYARPITFDLASHAGVDLGTLWRGRRWRTLLDLIDSLPPTSSYAVAVSSDTEHAEMLAKAMADRDDDAEDRGPSLVGWSREVDLLTSLRDDVRSLIYVVKATNGDKSARPPGPLPRPITPLQRAIKAAEFSSRQARHEALVARILPHKRTS